MVGYKILEVDRDKIARHPILRDLSKEPFCPICSFLVREPVGVASCPHLFCSSCLLERNSPQAVCPVDKQEFLVQETYPDKLTEEAVNDIDICCTFNSKTGEPCRWVGQVRHLEVHMDLHHKGAREAAAKAQYQAENCAQLSSAVSPSTTQGAFPGPSTLRLFGEPDGEESWKEVAESLIYKQRMDHKDIEDLKQQVGVLLEAYTTEKRYREQLKSMVASTADKVKLLETKQSMDRTSIDQLQRQLAAFGDAVVTETRERERLQNEMRVIEGQIEVQQSMDHLKQLKQQLATLSDALAAVSRQGEELIQEVGTAKGRVEVLECQQRHDQTATDQCKRQLEVFAEEFALEKRKHEQLQDNVNTADGKIQVLERELETQKNICASAGAECERGIETLGLESGLLQKYIEWLQNGHLDLQRSLANLEVQFRRFEDERL